MLKIVPIFLFSFSFMYAMDILSPVNKNSFNCCNYSCINVVNGLVTQLDFTSVCMVLFVKTIQNFKYVGLTHFDITMPQEHKKSWKELCEDMFCSINRPIKIKLVALYPSNRNESFDQVTEFFKIAKDEYSNSIPCTQRATFTSDFKLITIHADKNRLLQVILGQESICALSERMGRDAQHTYKVVLDSDEIES